MTIAPLWTVADCRPSSVDKKSVDGQSPVRLCNYTDVYNNHYIDAGMDLMAASASADQIERFQVRPGDVLITKDSESNEDIGVPALVRAAEPGMVCGYHLTLLRPDPDRLDSVYLYWFLESRPVKDFWRTSSFGVTRFSLVSPTVWRLPVPLPPLDEQRRVAEFLDRETAEIDAMDAELNHLIQTLHERRTARVRLATAGAGEWPVSAMQYVCSIETGERDTIDAVEGGAVPFYVRSASIEAIDAPTHTGEAVLTPGDGAGVGKIYHHHRGGDFAAHQRVYVMRDFHPAVYPRFFYWHFSGNFGALTEMGTAQSTVPSLRRPMLAAFPIPLPPIHEQRRLAAELDVQTARIDDMIADANRLKTLLAERRSTLITEVVTGKKEVPA